MRTDPFLFVVILGGGVHAFIMEIMDNGGPFECNRDWSIFTGAYRERLSIYYHLDWTGKQLGFPLYVVANGHGLLKNLKTITNLPYFHSRLRHFGLHQRKWRGERQHQEAAVDQPLHDQVRDARDAGTQAEAAHPRRHDRRDVVRHHDQRGPPSLGTQVASGSRTATP